MNPEIDVLKGTHLDQLRERQTTATTTTTTTTTRETKKQTKQVNREMNERILSKVSFSGFNLAADLLFPNTFR